MLTIICGEDSVSSREFFLRVRKEVENRDNQIYDVKANNIEEIPKSFADATPLFSQRLIFFTEGLNKRISKRSNPSFLLIVEELIRKKSVEIIDWEDYTPRRELKLTENIIIKEFKLPVSVFNLLDSCYPGNLKTFITLMSNLPERIDEMFIFVMLIRHIHNLFILKNGGLIKSIQSWQLSKLKSQSSYWNLEKLESFYDGLYRIEVGVKTGKNPYSLKKSIDLLACYFL
jgi:hypothetical protein